MSDSVRPHRRQPTRLPCPWDSPGKNTGVGCHFLLQCMKVKGWKNIFHENGKQKKAGVAILISEKIDLKIEKITRDKEGHYIMIKGSIQEEDITIVNICASNIVQFSSVTQWCLTLLDPVNRSTPGLPVYHQLPEFTQTHIHRVGDAIQPSHPPLSLSPPAPNPSQHQSLFQ